MDVHFFKGEHPFFCLRLSKIKYMDLNAVLFLHHLRHIRRLCLLNLFSFACLHSQRLLLIQVMLESQ